MKYCNTCGSLIKDRARKCSNCGTKVDENIVAENVYGKSFTSQEDFKPSSKAFKDLGEISASQKKNLFYITPFFLIPGIGFMYAGEKKKGFYFFTLFIITVIIDVTMKVNGLIGIVIGITTPAYLILMVWGIVGAVKQIRIHNENIEMHNQKARPMRSVDAAIFQ